MIDAIITRLAANKAALSIKIVEGSASFQAAFESEPPDMPAAYVMLAEESFSPSETTCVVEQEARTCAAVVFAVRNVTDVLGAAASGDLKARRAAVAGKLVGWSPLAGYSPLERGRGHLLAFKPGGLMYWQDLYISSHIERHDLQE